MAAPAAPAAPGARLEATPEAQQGWVAAQVKAVPPKMGK